jgi:CDGSH-type Zn-finger protein
MSEPKVGGTKPVVGKYEAGEYWWCACGRSANQPFCDGSHAGSGIEPRKIELSEETRCAWCTCKRTANAPFCDGAHKGLG